MKSLLRWGLGVLLLSGASALMIWAFFVGREEISREREMERPIKVSPRVGVASNGVVSVKLSKDAQALMGLKTTRLDEANASPEIEAHGSVADSQGLVALEAEISAHEAALHAARAVLERQRTLASGEGVSPQRSVEAAEAELALAESRLRTARGRLSAEWGLSSGDFNSQGLRDLADRLAQGQSALVRVSLSVDEKLEAKPQGVRIATLGDDSHWIEAKACWASHTVDPMTRGPSLWARIDEGAGEFLAGTPVTARIALPGAPVRGVLVPRSALVRWNGKVWVYIVSGDDSLTRREAILTAPLDRGWLSAGSLEIGSEAVSRGAQAVLSEELKSQIEVGEEGEGE